MDPQLKSVITSVLLAGATALATWGVSKGVVPAADQNAIANAIVTLALGVGAGAIGWIKTRQLAPKALIEAVNSGNNGVKVVPEAGPGTRVSGPLNGATK